MLGQGAPRVSVRKEIRSWQEENKIPGSYMSFYLPLPVLQIRTNVSAGGHSLDL